MLGLLLASIAIAQGVWENIGSSGTVCIHTFLLPNNRITCLERPHEAPYPPNPNTGGFLSSEIDLQNGGDMDGRWVSSFKPIDVKTSPFCGGHASMADGSILVVGGDNNTNQAGTSTDGRQSVRTYTPCPTGSAVGCIGSWEDKQSMSTQRWYPTIVTLGDGSNIIFGGQKQNLDFGKLDKLNDNPTYEYFPPKEGQWPKVLELLQWAYPHNMYPQSFVLPSGKVFLLASNRSLILDPKTEKITDLVDMPNTGHAPWIYPHTPNMFIKLMTKANKWAFELMICGGSEGVNPGPEVDSTVSSDQCLSIKPDDDKPEWKIEEKMPTKRLMPDSVLLPNGKVLVVNGLKNGVAGGNQGQVLYAHNPAYEADLYDPAGKEGSRWSSVAVTTEKRLYHSGALLLETGHVITTGSEMDNYDDFWPIESRKPGCFPSPDIQVNGEGCKDAFNYNIARFTPPYLENPSARPKISFAPKITTHGSLISIEVGDTNKVATLSFIRTSTTTHSTNTDQRFIELKIEAKTASAFYVRIPESTGQAPPGNWFLFAMGTDGTPSKAATINLKNGVKTEESVPADATKVDNASASLTSFVGIAVALIILLVQ